MIRGTKTLDVPAAADDVFARLVDLERYPDWQSFVADVTVLDRDAGGRPSRVETKLDAKAVTLRAVLRYAYTAPDSVSWTYEDGDLKDMTGSFALTEVGTTTTVTMTVAVDPGFRLGLLLRGPIEERVRTRVLDGTLTGLAGTFATT